MFFQKERRRLYILVNDDEYILLNDDGHILVNDDSLSSWPFNRMTTSQMTSSLDLKDT